jgi:hypothetical protein
MSMDLHLLVPPVKASHSSELKQPATKGGRRIAAKQNKEKRTEIVAS